MSEYWVGMHLGKEHLHYVYDPRIQIFSSDFVNLYKVWENKIGNYKRASMRTKVATCQDTKLIHYAIRSYQEWLHSADGINFINHRLTTGLVPSVNIIRGYQETENVGQPDNIYRPREPKRKSSQSLSGSKIGVTAISSDIIDALPDSCDNWPLEEHE